ncbi:hypothetical protein M1293_03015 [Candidatus Parvarchaeota archaeon]|nr:hypothetical protein [Candidatus Parvarchaeota archaeon]
MEIKKATSRKILNANSNFTIQVELETENGTFKGSSPAGESVSKYEVSQFSENIDKEIEQFNAFLLSIAGKNIESIEDIYSLEESVPKEFIGGPSLSLSYALVCALASSKRIQPYSLFGTKGLVIPVCKMLGGGMHASNLGMDIQEILVTTISNDISESVDGTLSVYKKLKEMLKKSTASFLGGVDPEGGFITGLDNYESLKIVKKAAEEVIKQKSLDIRLGVDMAASTFYKDGRYHYKRPFYGKETLDRGEQVDLVRKVSEEFDLYYVEDPVDETLPDDYGEVLKGSARLVVGDDLTATKTERLEKVYKNINATLVKPNQVGLLSAVKDYFEMTKKHNLITVVSHRSEETNMSIISDIAAGNGAKYLKVGINRGERVEKINRLLEIK